MTLSARKARFRADANAERTLFVSKFGLGAELDLCSQFGQKLGPVRTVDVASLHRYLERSERPHQGCPEPAQDYSINSLVTRPSTRRGSSGTK
jgi:hypothetical protein